MSEIYLFFITNLQCVTLVESSMRHYFSPCTNFPTQDNLTRSEQAEWQMPKGGETGKVTNELGSAALNLIRGPHLIHWSMMAKFMSVSSSFAIPHSHYSVSFQLRNREHAPWPNKHDHPCCAAGWQTSTQATRWIGIFLVYGSMHLC